MESTNFTLNDEEFSKIKKIANEVSDETLILFWQFTLKTLGELEIVNNQSLSKYLVREGFAFAYRKYSTKFIEDENYAKKNKKGMWSMTFEYPWDYRGKN